jgi:RNA recognition motif-containing protein
MVNECTIFVGQLNFRTNSMTLGKTFEALKIGPVVSAKVVYFPNEPGKSRGYGFVEFRDGASVQKAIDLMDGKDLDGRTVIVKPRSEGSGRPPTMYRRNNSGSFPNGVGSFHSSGPPPNRNGVGGGAPPARGNDRSRSPQPRRE